MTTIQAGTSGSVVIPGIGNSLSGTGRVQVALVGIAGYVGTILIPFDGSPGSLGFTASGTRPPYSPGGASGQSPLALTINVPDFLPDPASYPVVFGVEVDSASTTVYPFNYSLWRGQLTVTAPGGGDPDPDPDPFNLVPQGQSRTFPVDAIDLPTAAASALWEVYRFDERLDSGTRFDRLGINGWGVEPSIDFGKITVTVPRSALIGEGYDARIRQVGGDFPTVSFIVTPATDPPEDIHFMAHYLFSTGELIVSLPLPAPALERQNVGAPTAATLPLANLVDDSLETLTDFTQTDAGNYQYLIADLGAAQKIGRVIAGNVALVGAGTVLAYVSAAKITNGNFSGATALVSGSGAIGADREYVPAANAASVTGRYVYLVPSAGTGITVGDLDIRSEEWKIGTLQSVGVDSGYQHKELRGAAAFNHFPVADAQYDGSFTLSSESGEFDARSVNAFTGAMVSAALTDPQTITAGALTKPLPFVAEFRSQDTEARPFRAVIFYAYAPGFTWSLKREDFSTNNFTAATYLPDATGRAWRLYLGQ